jgi:hypothetical protein
MGKQEKLNNPKIIYKYIKLSNLVITYKPETYQQNKTNKKNNIRDIQKNIYNTKKINNS